MNLFEISTAYGARVLARFALLAVLFLALHVLRKLLHVLVCGLTALMRGIDHAALAQLSTPPRSTRRSAYGSAWGRAAA